MLYMHMSIKRWSLYKFQFTILFVAVYISQPQTQEEKHLGNIQQGSINVKGCTVETIEPAENEMWVLKIHPRLDTKDDPAPTLEVGSDTRDQMISWGDALQEGSRQVKDETKKTRTESLKIAKELSDLIVYCRAVPFLLSEPPFLLKRKFFCYFCNCCCCCPLLLHTVSLLPLSSDDTSLILFLFH